MDKDDLMFYGNYADTLLEKKNMILMEMDRILEKMTKESNYAPAEHIRSRIKSATSLREKLDKKWVARNGVCRTDIPVRYYRRKGCNSFYR